MELEFTMVAKAPVPLSGAIPAEVPLERAPLARVIAQVRFPTILSINSADKVADFQEAIRDIYPFLEEETGQNIHLTPGMPPRLKEDKFWRFSDLETNPKWRVTLNTNFLAIESYHYASRADFLQRLRKVLHGLKKVFRPAEVQRLGIRYVNRLTDEGFDKAEALISGKILGVANADNHLGAAMIHMLTETQILAKEGQILGRWGNLQPGASYDIDAVPPLQSPSWIIDLDMFTTEPFKFDIDETVSRATQFSQRLYAVFRAMVTEDFLDYYGRKK